MNGFTVGRAFSETFGFLKSNWLSMLIWMGGAVLAIALLFSVMLGGNLMAFGGGGEPDPTAVLGMFGQMILFAMVTMVILYAAGMMIWRMGLAPDASSGDIGWALLAGALYAFAMLVLLIAVYILITIIAFIVLAVIGVGGAGLSTMLTDGAGPALGGGVLVAVILFYIAFLVFWLWFQGRLMSAGPVMADRKMTNPFTAIAESWRLSGPSQWKVTGFLVVFTIATYAVLFVLFMVGTTVRSAVFAAGDGSGPGVAVIVMALIVYLPFIMLWMSVPAGVYRALGGGVHSTDQETFA